MQAIPLAARTRRIDASGIRRIFDLARRMEDPINLSIGQPDFDVPGAVKEAAVRAIRDGCNKYTPTQGIGALREQLAAAELAATGRAYGEDELMVTSGVSGGILLALLALVDEGDEVVIADPYFVMYKHLVRFLGGEPVYLDTYASGFGIDPVRLKAAIGPRTKAVLLNSPANPTGHILDQATVKAVAEVCHRRGVTAISDEIYRAFAYIPCPSISSYYENTLVLGGHSKAFAMTGWRLGYAAGPAELIQAMAMIQQYSFVCAPSIAQYAALACPTVDLGPNIAAYRHKRDLMTGLLGRCFEVAEPDGAFYLWVRAPDGETGTAFCERAIAANVLVIPGAVFSERDSHFRVCYTVADEQLERGAGILNQLVVGG